MGRRTTPPASNPEATPVGVVASVEPQGAHEATAADSPVVTPLEPGEVSSAGIVGASSSFQELTPLEELERQREERAREVAAFDAKIQALKLARRLHAVEEIRAIVEKHGLTQSEVLEVFPQTYPKAINVAKGKAAPGVEGEKKVSPLTGTKAKVKYRGPNGETWAGRGQKPRWLAACLKQGRTLEEFAV